MKDMNEFRFSGTVERFDRIATKTGTPMVAFTVLCWRERIRAVAFKDMAEQTELAPGDRVECCGHIQSTSWTDQNGQQRSGWQVIAHEIDKANEDRDRHDSPHGSNSCNNGERLRQGSSRITAQGSLIAVDRFDRKTIRSDSMAKTDNQDLQG